MYIEQHYSFNPTNRHVRQSKSVPDGLLSTIKDRGVEEIQNDLNEQFKQIYLKYGTHNRTT